MTMRSAEQVRDCAQRAGEPVWRLPLHPDFAEMTKGNYAQLTNRPEPRARPRQAPPPSSCTTSPATSRGPTSTWPASASDRKRPYLDRLGSGWGVRLLAELGFGRLRKAAPRGPL